MCERHTHTEGGREGWCVHVLTSPYITSDFIFPRSHRSPSFCLPLPGHQRASSRGALNTDSSRITGSPSHTHGTAHKHTPLPTLPALCPHFNPKSPLRSIKKFQVAKLRRRGRAWHPPLPLAEGLHRRGE